MGLTVNEMKDMIKKCDMDKPFAFVSYSKLDAEKVYPLVLKLQEDGYNIWIDKELNAQVGKDWQKGALVALAKQNCKVLLFCMSENSLISAPVCAELCWTKSKKVKNNHGGQELKIVPVLMTDDWKTDQDKDFMKWILAVSDTNGNNSLSETDIEVLTGIVDKKYTDGLESVDNHGEIAMLIRDEIFIPLGGSKVTCAEVNGISTIESNMKNTRFDDETEVIVGEVLEEVKQEISLQRDMILQEDKSDVQSFATHQPKGPIYYIKGAKYEAYLTNEDDKYTVLKGSKIAENWKEWAGTKNISLLEDKVGENCIMLEDAIFNTVSAVAKFVKGTSTDGGGVFVEKNLVTEIKPVSLNAVQEVAANLDTKKKSASITGDITYTLYGKEHTDNQANMMLRVFAQVLKRHPEQIAKLPEQAGMNCAMKYEDIKDPGESSAYPTYFRSCRNFTFPNGESICIGTAYSSGDKMKKIARLLDICGEDRSIFYSEQIELPEAKAVKVIEGGKVTTNANGLKYGVYGESFIGDQTDMMTTICSKIIERHPDKLQAVVDGTLCAGYKDADTMAKTYFRVYREYSCNGTEYVIGTSFGMPAKIKEIEKVLYICGEDTSNIEIEGVELKVAPPVRKGRTKVETDNFLDD